MWFLKKSLLGLALVVGAVCSSFAAEMGSNLHFDGIADSLQKQYWDYLLRYKLWGTTGVSFGARVRFPDEVGWTGTATGDFTTQEGDSLGGPVIIGGNIALGMQQDFTTGPVRSEKGFTASNPNGHNYFKGQYCVADTNGVNAEAIAGINRAGGNLRRGADAATGACADDKVPYTKKDLKIPDVVGSHTYTSSIHVPRNGGTRYLDVPPGEGMIDLYVDSLTMGNDGKLFIRMPPGGRLTRVFLNYFEVDYRVTIQVIYVGSDYTYNNGSYTDPGSYKVISNDDYAGNLMFYFPNSVTFNQNVENMYPLQGSFISKDTIRFANQAMVAGQLLAEKIEIGSQFNGSSFHFVPFDPPMIDFLAAANFPVPEPDSMGVTEMVYLSDGNQSGGAIKLDSTSENDITFKYCFKFEGADDGQASNNSFKAGKADVSWNAHSADMPLCSADTSTHPEVTIKAGDLYPSSAIKVWVYRDGLVENTELFTMHIYNIKGSIFKNNQKSRDVGLFIEDKDGVIGNNAPTAVGYTATIREDAAIGTSICKDGSSPKICDVQGADADGDTLSYEIVANNINNTFAIDNSGHITLAKKLDYETLDRYPLSVMVSDGNGGSRTVIVTVIVTDVNERPSARDTAFTIDENSPINTIVGVIPAQDFETSSSMLKWKIKSGNSDSKLTKPFDISGGRLFVNQYPIDYEVKNKYTLGIEVCDDGRTGSGTVDTLCTYITATINIRNLNEAPVVTHDTCWIKENTTTFLNKSGSSKTCRVTGSDPEKGRVTYSLTSDMFKVGTDGKITLKSGKTPDYETTQEYQLVVTVADSVGLSSSALALIKVLDVNEEPTAQGCTGSITENPPANMPTGCWIKADDEEDGYQKLTYTITGGAGANLFAIDNDGNISVKGEVSIDYDTMSPKYYELTVKVSDTGGAFTTVTATINVTDINEPPSYVDVECSVKENTTAFTNGSNCKIVSVDPENRKLTFKIEDGNVMDGSNPVFAINDSTGVITVKRAPDYEKFTGTILYISVKDRDKSGNLENTVYAKATITVIDVNEAPTATVRNGTVDENSPVGTYVDCGSDASGNAYYCVKGQDVDANTTLTYKIIAGDPNGVFTVNSVGDILVAKDEIDYETQPVYNLTIRIRDNGKPGTLKDTLYVDKSVKITVNNGNEKPSVTGIPDQTIDEHTAVGTVVGTITGTDPEDQNNANSTLRYYFNGGNDGQVFAIDSITGVITVAKDIDYETLVQFRADTVFKIKVFAKDVEGLRSTETIVTIAIRDINEGADIDNTTMAVAENQPKGTKVGTLELYDPDTKNENLQNTFQAIGGDKDLFTIDSKTGVIKTNAVFDYESKTTYSLVVRVYDQDGNADTATVTIKITDVKETSSILVTYAETGSGAENWTNPVGTLYTNENSMLLQWTADGKQMPDTLLTNLKEGFNVVTLTYTDPTKNTGVTETIGIFVSTRTPEVTVTTAASHETGANIYTLVETVDESDTSVYVNKKNNDIVITVKEPVLDQSYTDSTCNYETHSFTVNTELEPVTIPSSTYDAVNKVVAAGPVLNTNPNSEVTYSQYNGNQIKVSYTEKVAGVDVVISYITDREGNVEKIPVIGANGKIDSIEVITVSYQVNVGGKVVNVSYLADAATGQALKTTTVNNGSGSSSASNSGSNGGSNSGKPGSNSGSNSGSNGGSNSGKPGSNSGSNGGNGGSGSAANNGGETGNSAPVYMYSLTEGEVLFSVTYDYTTKVKGMGETTVQVSYTVDQKGKVTKDKDGNVGYEVSYTYVNEMGNSSTQSVYIVVDLIPPKVKIESPNNDDVLHSNMVEVKWCVDFGDGRGCVPQDSLTFEGLQSGEVNEIVRFYRDKAGNEASDVVYVMAKNTKDVDISVEKPVTTITQDDVDKYYASKEPEKGQTFAISIYNPQTEKEIETMVGGSFKNKEAAHDSVYPGLKGHLGPTLGIQAKVPVINSVDGLATLDDLVGDDGLILLDAVDAVGSKKVTVEEFVKDHCDADFRGDLGSDISKANLYNTEMKAKIWVYTSLGQFVDYFGFTQELNDPSYASDAGVLTLYFEMKPDKNGDLHTDSGRLYATGAYIYKTEITMSSKLHCDLPPFDDASNKNVMGQKKKVTEDLLKSFGYKRPTSKK